MTRNCVSAGPVGKGQPVSTCRRSSARSPPPGKRLSMIQAGERAARHCAAQRARRWRQVCGLCVRDYANEGLASRFARSLCGRLDLLSMQLPVPKAAVRRQASRKLLDPHSQSSACFARPLLGRASCAAAVAGSGAPSQSRIQVCAEAWLTLCAVGPETAQRPNVCEMPEAGSAEMDHGRAKSGQWRRRPSVGKT